MWGDVLPRSLLERPGPPIGCWLQLPPDWLVLGADWQLGQCGRTGPGRVHGLLTQLVIATSLGVDGLEGANLFPIAPRMAKLFLSSYGEVARGFSVVFVE